MNKKIINYIINNGDFNKIKNSIISHISKGYDMDHKLERLAAILVDNTAILHTKDIDRDKLIAHVEKEHNIYIEKFIGIDHVDNITAEITVNVEYRTVYYTSSDEALVGKKQYYKDNIFNVYNVTDEVETGRWTVPFVNYNGETYDILKS